MNFLMRLIVKYDLEPETVYMIGMITAMIPMGIWIAILEN
jgi:hypothetical protein